MLDAAFVTKDISPNIKFVPLFKSIAIPIVTKNKTGSNHESVVIINIINISGSTNFMIFVISCAVETSAATVS